MEARHDGLSQRWKVLYTDQVVIQKSGLNRDFGFHVNRPFMIFSKMYMRRALEVVGEESKTNIVLNARPYPAGDRLSKAWYSDSATKTIRSIAFKDQSLTIRDGGQSDDLQVDTTNARWFQLFSVEGDFIVNERGKILEVADGIDKEGSHIKVGQKHGGLGQRWEVAYLDQLVPDPKKGELSSYMAK